MLLDAGVSGGATAYENGLTVMIGGSDDDVQRAMPVLNGFAKAVVHCGPLGAGMVAKLAKNVVTYSSWAVAREAALLAIAGGVSLERFLEVLDQGADFGTDPLVWLRIKQAGAQVPDNVLAPFERIAEKVLLRDPRVGPRTCRRHPDHYRGAATNRRHLPRSVIPSRLPRGRHQHGSEWHDRSTIFP